MNQKESKILELAERYKDPAKFVDVISNLNNLKYKDGKRIYDVGLILYDHSYFLHSIRVLEVSIQYFVNSRDLSGESKCNVVIGNSLLGLGDYPKAKKYYEKALKIAIEIGDKEGEEKCYGNLGAAFHCLGDYLEAKEYYEKALKIATDIGDLDSNRIISSDLGNLYVANNELSSGYSYLKKSIELGESIGGKLIEEEQKIGFYGLASDAYYNIIPLCLTLGKKEEAFQFVERSKSKAFIDLLTTSNIHLPSI